MAARSASYGVVIEQDGDGGYMLEVPALPGCFTHGDTPDDVLEHAHEAIALYLDEIVRTGGKLPPDTADASLPRVRVTLG